MSVLNWLVATYVIATSDSGLSANQLSQEIQCPYRTAFSILSRLRQAMAKDEAMKLCGNVELGLVPLPGIQANPMPDSSGTVIFGLVEYESRMDRFGQMVKNPTSIRLRLAPRGEWGLLPILDACCSKDVTIFCWQLDDLVDEFFPLRFKNEPLVIIPSIHSSLDDWLMKTHRGRVEARYLQSYLHEFSFRFNHRTNAQKAFRRLLELLLSMPVAPKKSTD